GEERNRVEPPKPRPKEEAQLQRLRVWRDKSNRKEFIWISRTPRKSSALFFSAHNNREAAANLTPSNVPAGKNPFQLLCCHWLCQRIRPLPYWQ
ncbi:hypothetical protein KI387_027634, partial [Taxus chinensis]